MNVIQIREIFDREQRRDVVYADATRQALPRVVRHTPLYGGPGFVIHTTLDEENADAEIAAQLAFFSDRKIAFEWKAYDYDQPPDLRQRLARHGLQADDREAVMVLDLNDHPGLLAQPIERDIRRVIDAAGVERMIGVEEAVWEQDRSQLGARLARDLEETPDEIRAYLAYVDGEAAATAWIYFHAGSQFASLWGGSTLARFRKQGLYSALLAVRAREARARGARFLTVDASPMSEPILAKHGFITIANAWGYMWEPSQPEDRSETSTIHPKGMCSDRL